MSRRLLLFIQNHSCTGVVYLNEVVRGLRNRFIGLEISDDKWLASSADQYPRNHDVSQLGPAQIIEVVRWLPFIVRAVT